MTSRLVHWLLALSLTCAACGGDTDDSSSGSSTGTGGSSNGTGGSSSGSGGSASNPASAATLDSFLSAYTNAICGIVGSCCAAKGFDGSGQQCRALLGATDKDKFNRDAYNPTKAQQCLDAVNSAKGAACGESLGLDSPNLSVCKEAAPLKDGGKGLGDPCEDDDQCSDVAGAEIECVRETKLSDGGSQELRYCRAVRVGKEGDGPCTRSVDGSSYSSFSSPGDGKVTEGYSCDAAQGLYCPGGGEKCARFRADGESCQPGDQCLKNSRCKDGTCAPKAKEGEACSSSFSDCVDKTRCDQASKTCKAKLPEGSACKSNDECLGGCTNGACEGTGDGLEDLGYAFLCGSK